MKKTTKAILLSVLILPGIGHIYLKKYLIGSGFICSFLYLFLGFIRKVFNKSQEIVDRILNGEIPLEISAITQALTEQELAQGQQTNIIGYILIAIWLLAALDAYRLANNLDKSEKTN